MPYENVRWVGADAINFFGSAPKAWFFTAGRAAPIVRGGGINQPGMHLLRDRLLAGDWVHMFPEGGRTRDPEGRMMPEFKNGIGWLIAQAKPLVLPFYHYGMQSILPVGSSRPRSGKRVRVVFGEPMDCNAEWIDDDLPRARRRQDGRPEALGRHHRRAVRQARRAWSAASTPAPPDVAGRRSPSSAWASAGAYVTAIWLLSLALRNASIIDIFWGPGFALLAIVYALLSDDGYSGRQILVCVLVAVWGLRLGGYILSRNAGHGEDYRYQKMREHAGPALLVALAAHGLLAAGRPALDHRRAAARRRAQRRARSPRDHGLRGRRGVAASASPSRRSATSSSRASRPTRRTRAR